MTWDHKLPLIRKQVDDKRRILATQNARGRFTKISTSWNQEKELSLIKIPELRMTLSLERNLTIPRKGLSLNQKQRDILNFTYNFSDRLRFRKGP